MAIAMGGGGARAAFQAGVLRALARELPDLRLDILTGVSAGAINTAYLAANCGSLKERAEGLAELWGRLTPDQVFRTGTFPLALNVLRWGMRLVSGGRMVGRQTRGFVDTTPLHALLERALGADRGTLAGIEENLKKGIFKALAITTTSYSTGQSITWVEGEDIQTWERAHRRSRRCKLTTSHVMASCAIPLFFPAIQIDGSWYGDGGIRLSAPLSPAIHLGAQRILAISTRYPRSAAEADRSSIDGYPPPAQVGGVLINAIFLDLLDADSLRVERINRLARSVPEEDREGMRVIDLLVLRPSADLGELANAYEADLPRAFRFLARGIGTRETRANDLLSLVMFQPDYLNRLIELGEEEFARRKDEIIRFVAGTHRDGIRSK